MTENDLNKRSFEYSVQSTSVKVTDETHFIKKAQKESYDSKKDIMIDNGSLIINKDATYAGAVPQFTDNSFMGENPNHENKNANRSEINDKNVSNSISIPNNTLLDSPEKNSSSIANIVDNDNNNLKLKRKEQTETELFLMKDNNEFDLERHPIIFKIIENLYYQCFIISLTIWALFSHDILLLACPISADDVFDIITIVIFTALCIDLILMSILSSKYRWSVFFWLDLVSTLTLIIDISWISEEYQNFEITRTGKISRLGSRAARMVRSIRLVKTLNIFKLRKELAKRRNSVIPRITPYPNNLTIPDSLVTSEHYLKGENNLNTNNELYEKIPNLTPDISHIHDNSQNLSKVFPINTNSPKKFESRKKIKSNSSKPLKIQSTLEKLIDENEANLEETKTGQNLTEKINERVVLLVLILIILIPLFRINFYTSDDASTEFIVNEIMTLFQSNPSNNTLKNLTYWSFVTQQINAGYPIVYMNLSGMEYSTTTSPDDLRNEEKHVTIVKSADLVNIYTTTIDLRQLTKLESGLSIGRTLFTCFALVIASFFFSRDVNILLLKPIEKMIEKVKKIAINPLALKNEKVSKKSEAKNEIVSIENAIIKLGTFLALGFGEAGAEIIASNMAKEGDVNPMMPGVKKYAIFGFCDIRNFTDATEVLQEEVMGFVNSIAEIVHRFVDKYTGAANKNIGDAFLLVWKFDDSIIVEHDDSSLQLVHSRKAQNVADLALISFLKIYARINKDPAILRYRDDPRLNERLVNYRVKMGFGLHVGWGIEGAIGSEFKIDASYLSPNVNMASRLEAATKQYGVCILFSGDFAQSLSEETRERCRLIDIVTVKGSNKPIEIWTIDANIKKLNIAKPNNLSKNERKLIQQEKKEAIKEYFVDSDEKASSLFDSDKDLLKMIDIPQGPFYASFNQGFQNYIEGEWKKAKFDFERCLELNPQDGPAKTLYQVLRDYDFNTPIEWRGYRQLMEK